MKFISDKSVCKSLILVYSFSKNDKINSSIEGKALGKREKYLFTKLLNNWLTIVYTLSK